MKQVRLITFAWGDGYVDELLEYALPAVLAPGNLPALAEAFDCELVFLTEARQFERVERHRVWQRLKQYCKPRLVAIDDLLSAPLYGLSLTYATYRGFADLGERVTETALVFFTSDWLLADGSYRSLIPLIREGKQLVVSPSYCVVSERALPKIRARLEEGDGVLAVPHREMADWAIRHRHNTIRGKTLNRPLFHMDVMDQFYWRVDDRTLLGRQMPIAIVCMMPDRFIETPETFWDYGTVSELCASAEPCVLGDSDDFLMIELRGEETYAEGLRIGWRPLQEVGRHLASFVTKDHLDYGRHTLCLHSGDVPPHTAAESAKLEASVAQAYAQIPAPVDHKSHPFWWPQRALFDIVRREFLGREIVSDWRWGYRASPYTNMVKAEIERLDKVFDGAPGGPHAPADRAREVDAALTAIGACVGQLEGLFGGDLNALRKALQVRSRRWRSPPRSSRTGPAMVEMPPPGTPLATSQGALRRALAGLREALNSPHRLHPDRAVADPLIRTLAAANLTAASRILLVCSEAHGLAARSVRSLGFGCSMIPVEDVLDHGLPAGADGAERWDAVVFDLCYDDLQRFRPALRRILPAIRDGGVAALFHPGRRGPLAMDPWTILNVFPPSDRITVRYAGSRWTHLATGIFDRLASRLPKVSLAGFNLTPIAALAGAAPFSLVASLQADDDTDGRGARLPESCASMLLALPVDPAVRGELEGW